MTCFECGLPAECEHHVVPRSIGGTKTVALCEVCHGKIHGGGVGKSSLTRAALAVKRTRGERIGQIPFGSRLAPDGVHLEADPAEQDVLARLRSLRAEGLTVRAIAARLNLDGCPCRGSAWHKTTIARIVKRDAVPR
jgi:hypothetical protein